MSPANSATLASRHNSNRQNASSLGFLCLLPSSQPDNNNNNISTHRLIDSHGVDLAYDIGLTGAGLDFTASPDLLLSSVELDNNEDNWLTDQCLLDPSLDLSGGGVLIPDMTTQTQSLEMSSPPSLPLEDDFFAQETNNLLNTTPPASSANTLIPPPNSSSNSPSYAANSSVFSTFSVTLNNQSSPSESSLSSSTKRKASSPEDEVAARDFKRQRNTLAARKHRQKRLDRIAELEKALADMTGNRNDLRLKLARREAEVDALREMLGRKK